ncbi:MAG: hypothetical protein ACRDVP_02180, partial [Acidimicrobiales bacterium]
LDPSEVPQSRKTLNLLASRPNVLGRIAAGLGAIFVPLAERMIAPGGRVALVLPKTLLTGLHWDETRQLLSQNFHVETIVSSHEAGHWNFSDSTDLSEVLVIARKLAESEDRTGQETTWVQLTKNPDNAIDALGVASSLSRMGNPGVNGTAITVGSGLFSNFGTAFSRPAPITDDPWLHAHFASAELDQVAMSLAAGGSISLPRSLESTSIPLVALGEIAEIGPNRPRIHEAFVLTDSVTSYPSLWGHDSNVTTTIEAKSNTWLAVTTGDPRTPKWKTVRTPERAASYAAELWQGSGTVMVAERLWLITHRASSVCLPSRALANMMWPVQLNKPDPDLDHCLTLWMNPTLGLIAWVGTAEETRGPWMSMKKNKLVNLPVLDVPNLTTSQRGSLLQCWEAVHDCKLRPIAQTKEDPIRGQIDAAIAQAFKISLDSIEAIRELFSGEPRLKARQARPTRKQRVKPPDIDELSLFG